MEQTRADGFTAGLVVLATGLGKTWLAAFDSDRSEFHRVLFVAHREEILNQAIETFRRIRPKARIGRLAGDRRETEADLLFASVQTLGRFNHLSGFAPNHFDYIVIDEFHHAAASTYRRIIDHFSPKFLIGLTATPERTDGGDLLGLCQENLVFQAGIHEGIEGRHLCPFHYFGVPDDVDYANIPWRNAKFDLDELTAAVATENRAQNAIDHLLKLGGRRTLGFCCSQRHANFMAAFCNEKGIRAVAVHAGAGSAPRASSLQRLQAGELDIVFAVDMFNEGLDVPTVDTVLMLRPTELTIIWLQQLGRELRLAPEKDRLVVIDYIGNHRAFVMKLRSLAALTDVEVGSRGRIREFLEAVRENTIALPSGCEVTSWRQSTCCNTCCAQLVPRTRSRCSTATLASDMASARPPPKYSTRASTRAPTAKEAGSASSRGWKASMKGSAMRSRRPATFSSAWRRPKQPAATRSSW